MTTCEWCGDEIADDEPRVEVARVEPGGLSDERRLATFHDPKGEMPCFGEARDYGWSG